MVPAWLHLLSILSLALGAASAGVIAVDEVRRPQSMWIMNLVWPATALFGTALTLWAYYSFGRPQPPGARQETFAATVIKATGHCGAGCTLGDICAEWLAFGVPAVAVWLGWRSVFAEKMFAVWVLDYLLAFGFGVGFQFFTIAPMRGLGLIAGLREAVKADALSLTAWQVGMYGFMALASLYLFRHVLGVSLEVNSPEFWFMMQIAMLCGFATSYPVNWRLLRAGIKEPM